MKEFEKERAYDWMQRLSRSLIRFETQAAEEWFKHVMNAISRGNRL